MIPRLDRYMKPLLAHEKGAVLIFVSLCLLPLFLMLGLAIDNSFGLAQKRKLQMACDAAAKAGAVNGNGQTSTVTSVAQKVFTANTPNMTGITGPTVSLNTTGDLVTVSASIQVPNTFMSLGGISTSIYNASATASMFPNPKAEIAVVIDASTTNGNWVSKVRNALNSFANNLPSTALISIVPIATQLLLDPATTNPGALFNHLSTTTNDELANPAFYSLSSNYSWNITNYNNIYNYLYGNTFPASTSYFPLPGTCTGWGGPGTYLACAAFYPSQCSVGRPSCRSSYTYTHYSVPPVLPLTANRTLLSNYINTTLGAFNPVDNGAFTSLLVWGWRTIAPEWSDFWLVNANPAGTSRTSGQHPKAYNAGLVKNLILVVSGPPSWAASSLAGTYNQRCNLGTRKWRMSYYGILPLTTDRNAFLDITCDNYNYKKIDQALGLNTSPTNYYDQNNTSTQYGSKIVTEVKAKYQRICSNIKAQGIKVFVITQRDDSGLRACATNASSPYYQAPGNGSSHIQNAFDTVLASIKSSL